MATINENAYVLGGEGHYGFWNQEEPNQLKFTVNTYERTQSWGKKMEMKKNERFRQIKSEKECNQTIKTKEITVGLVMMNQKLEGGF